MKNKIKITYVVNDLLVGGAQKLVLDLARKLDKSEYEVEVVFLYDYEGKKVTLQKDFEAIEGGVKMICLEKLAESRNFGNLIKECVKYFKESQPSVVHIHLPNALIVGGVASVLNKTPFIIHEHNTHNFHTWKIKLVFLLLRPFAKLTICYAETVEKETWGTSNVLSKGEDLQNQKIVTVLNGIDVLGLSKTKEKLPVGSSAWIEKRKSIGVEGNQVVIFSAARFVKWKGHHLLIEGFKKMLDLNDDKNSILVIAGEGEQKAVCEKLANDFGIADRVKFLGARTDVAELLVVSDIYSLVFDYEKNMSEAEAIGIAGFEGMAAGLPVLIGEFGAAHFYINNWVNGVIVKKWDTEDLAKCLGRLSKDENLRKQIGGGAKQRIFELLDWSKIIQIYDKIYHKIAKSK